MSRILSLVCCALLAACSAVRNEFGRADPEEVAVVLGYEVAGSKSIDPKLAGAAYWAGIITGGLSGLALAVGSMTVNEVFRTNDSITMVDELNDAVYKSIEEKLTARGYKVTLLRKLPISFASWGHSRREENYLERIAATYQLTEIELQASGADTVLFVEYRIDANIKHLRSSRT